MMVKPQKSTATGSSNVADETVRRKTPETAGIHGVLIGVLTEFTEDGQPMVNFPGNMAVLPIPARVTTSLSTEAIDCEVALLFENGDISRPIIVGLIQQSVPDAVPASVDPSGDLSVQIWTPLSDSNDRSSPSELVVDGRCINLQAHDSIVLRCGKASITLTSSGKVIIRGAYVSSKSTGANRIKGGSVQIN